MHEMIPIFGMTIPLTAIIGAVIMIIYLRRYSNNERMAMIEKGVNPEIFQKKLRSGAMGALRAALLMIGGGIGLLLGYILDEYARIPEPLPYFAMLLICGGAGLGAAYVIEENKIKKDAEKGV